MKKLAGVVFGLLCAACIGCGGNSADLGKVTGTVTLDGAPVANAMVSFSPVAGGRGSVGTTDPQGNYTLAYGQEEGALVGMHKVAVRSGGEAAVTVDPNMSSDSADYEAQASGGSAADYNSAKTQEKIPTKYNTATTLEYEVKPGSNTINIEMTSN